MLLHLFLDLGVSATSKKRAIGFGNLQKALDAYQLPLPHLEEGMCQSRLLHLEEVPSLPARMECADSPV